MKTPADKNFSLPSDFLLGTASAATQIEGGATNHSWHRWSALGKIKDKSSSVTADDHWNRVAEDTALMAELGLHTVRIGLEWSRLQPEPDRFDDAALAHYRAEIEGIRAKGMVPLVTLHHFSNPLWFEDSGAFLRADAPAVFLDYVRYAVEGLGDLVGDWITFNEPSVYLIECYVWADWPPAHSSLGEYFRGTGIVLRAHREAYALIRRIRREKGWDAGLPTMVGVAHHLRVFDPLHAWNPLAHLACAVLRWLTQGRFVKGMTGRGGARVADFVGVNYYTRDIVAIGWKPANLFADLRVKRGAPVNDLGWEIYPEGLGRVLRRYGKPSGLPIWITENGTADAADAFRPAYIVDHLAVVARCVEAGLPVRRYYHWTLMDNFEWLEGYGPRFGLVAVDYADQKRSPRPSARLFARICAERAHREP